MARNICPSCGAVYNGRKCRNCLFVPFTEEIAHGLHTHEGEPLVLEKPVRKSVRPRYGKRKSPNWLKTVIAWILVINLLPAGVEWIQNGIDRAQARRAPEPVMSPLAVKLWEGEDITVWTDRTENIMEIPILVENNSRDDIYVSSFDVRLGDYEADYSGLYVEAYRNSWGRGYLYLDQEDAETAGSFEEITFSLDICDADSYDTIALLEGLSIQ